MKRFFLLLISSVYLFAYCYQPSAKSVDSKEVKLYKQIFPQNAYMPDSVIENKIYKNRLFTKEYMKRPLSQEDKRKLQLVIEWILALSYIDKLKKEHAPTEEDLKSFYLDKKDLFKPVEIVDISTIAVPSLKKADEIYQMLKKNPEKFEEIAKKESLDPSAKSGGKYKKVSILMFHPDIREWIRTHKTGDISEPIKVGKYYYIDRIDNKYKTSTDYNSVKKDIKELLENIYIKNMIDQEFEKLKSKVEEKNR